ncbi:MAG TPA: hypothetical protein VMS21_15125 [Methylomirabilota bacterium]|nr:hypothetical protein [Methylomirabilota bacterium]
MTINSPEHRNACARRLIDAGQTMSERTAFVGFDGFVDEILHVVDKRQNAEAYTRIPTIDHLARRIAGASGKSTNIELVTQRIKLGGNGPIMAYALAALGLKVTYLGTLGFPNLHPVFESFTRVAEVHSIGEAGHTDALEFEDGKLMLGKTSQLNELTWETIQTRFGRDRFAARFQSSDLIGFVNWTMIPYMSDLWQALLHELCPTLQGPRRKLFFDLADPEKRSREDLLRALELIVRFQAHFDVILGLNEKESYSISQALDLPQQPITRDGLCETAADIRKRISVDTIVIHPVAYALATSSGPPCVIEGPFVPRPVITTGAGDHFNAGFCLGKLLGLDDSMSLLTGVTTSGFYVRTGRSPSLHDLAGLLRDWIDK